MLTHIYIRHGSLHASNMPTAATLSSIGFKEQLTPCASHAPLSRRSLAYKQLTMETQVNQLLGFGRLCLQLMQGVTVVLATCWHDFRVDDSCCTSHFSIFALILLEKYLPLKKNKF